MCLWMHDVFCLRLCQETCSFLPLCNKQNFVPLKIPTAARLGNGALSPWSIWLIHSPTLPSPLPPSLAQEWLAFSRWEWKALASCSLVPSHASGSWFWELGWTVCARPSTSFLIFLNRSLYLMWSKEVSECAFFFGPVLCRRETE